MLDILNPNQRNPWVKKRGIDEIPGGDGGERHSETGGALGWTEIVGQGLPTRRVFSPWEREEKNVFRGCSNEWEIREEERITLKTGSGSTWLVLAVRSWPGAVCTSRPSRYVSVINDNHLVSLINLNAAKVDWGPYKKIHQQSEFKWSIFED
jgi:hypothetical protein